MNIEYNNYTSLPIWKYIFEDLQINNASFSREDWNSEYESLNIEHPDIFIKSRLAKKTPNKKGYFIAAWKKNSEGKNMPLETTDIKGLLVINIIDENKKGQFIFDKSALIKYGIISSDKSPGKMAFRVYPEWEHDLNKTAAKTQKWQSEYFIDLSDNTPLEELKRLYKI